MIAIITLFNSLEVDCCFDAIVCWLVIIVLIAVSNQWCCMHLLIDFDLKKHIISLTIDCCVESMGVFEGYKMPECIKNGGEHSTRWQKR
jgi:hypothetical protein